MVGGSTKDLNKIRDNIKVRAHTESHGNSLWSYCNHWRTVVQQRYRATVRVVRRLLRYWQWGLTWMEDPGKAWLVPPSPKGTLGGEYGAGHMSELVDSARGRMIRIFFAVFCNFSAFFTIATAALISIRSEFILFHLPTLWAEQIEGFRKERLSSFTLHRTSWQRCAHMLRRLIDTATVRPPRQFAWRTIYKDKQSHR